MEVIENLNKIALCLSIFAFCLLHSALSPASKSFWSLFPLPRASTKPQHQFLPTNKIDHATATGSCEIDSSNQSQLPTRTSSKQKQNGFLSASVDLFGRAAHAGKAKMGRDGGTATR